MKFLKGKGFHFLLGISIIMLAVPFKVFAKSSLEVTSLEYLDYTLFKVNVDTGTESTSGVNLILNLSGDISINDVSQGSDDLCYMFDSLQNNTKLSITCLNKTSGVMNGTIAEIKAHVGKNYSISIDKDTSDFGGLAFGDIKNIEVKEASENNQDEVKTSNKTLLIGSAAIFTILAVVLIILVAQKKKQ